MTTPEPPADTKPQPMLPVVLSIVLLAGILFFLILISGGFFLYVLLGVGLIAMAGLAHYLLWGQDLTRTTEGEREEARIQEETEQQTW